MTRMLHAFNSVVVSRSGNSIPFCLRDRYTISFIIVFVPLLHMAQHLELIDTLAERVQSLGGVAIADLRHVAELTRIERAPNGIKEVEAMLVQLLSAHETVITALVQVYDGALVVLAAWHDNELGFANRLAEVSQRLVG